MAKTTSGGWGTSLRNAWNKGLRYGGMGISAGRGIGRVGKWAFSGKHHQVGMDWLGLGPAKKGATGISKYLSAGRILGLGFAAYSAYEGYQEEGMWGATKSLATTYLMGRAFSMATGVAGLGLKTAAIGGAAYLGGAALYSAASGMSFAQNALAPIARAWVRDFKRKNAKLKMGTPDLDQFGTVSPMRQRSLMAIQNSKLNGRNALGNEASLLWQPYNR